MRMKCGPVYFFFHFFASFTWDYFAYELRDRVWYWWRSRRTFEPSFPILWNCIMCVCVLVSFCGYVGYDTFAWLDFLMRVFLFSNIHKLLLYLSRAVINSRWYLLLFSIDFFTIWCIVMELIKQKVGYSCWSFGFVFGNNTSRENSNGPHAFYKEIMVFFFWYGSNCLWWLWISVGALSSDSIVTCFVLLSAFISLCWWEIWLFDFELKLV